MKKHILLGAALLSLMATSCSNDDVINNGTEVVTGKTITLNATINNGADTRLAYGDDGNEMTVAWSNNEKFTLYKGTNGTGSEFTNSAEDTGKFIGNDIEGDGTYYAVYGEGITNTDGKLTIDLSGAQVGTSEENGIKEFMLASADALDSETTLTFDHKLTVLKMTLTLPSDVTGTVSEVTVSGLHNKASYTLSKGSYAYTNDGKGDITAANGETGFAITDHKITAYVAVFPESVAANQVKITAYDGNYEYDYTIASARDLTAGKVVPVDVTLVKKKNLKSVYTSADYYKWDAKTPISLGGGTQFAGSSSVAKNSCKYAPNRKQIMMYLGAGVYWDGGATSGEGYYDGNVQTYTLPNGTTQNTGLWLKKKEYIDGFSAGTARAVGKVSSSENSDCWHVGRPAAAEISEYFFLPASGRFWGGPFYGDSHYWTSVAANDTYGGRLSIGESSAAFNGGTTGHGYLPMVAE